jgi:hypothetical protein
MKLINANALDRKSGGAQWRDLRFSGPPMEMFQESTQTHYFLTRDRSSRAKSSSACVIFFSISEFISPPIRIAPLLA